MNISGLNLGLIKLDLIKLFFFYYYINMLFRFLLPGSNDNNKFNESDG